MSTSTLIQSDEAIAGDVRVQRWLWPNVISLDAPVVAVLWQLLLAHSERVRLNPWEPMVLALAVWCIYVSDQIFDALRPAMEGWQPARKRFYRRHLRSSSLAGLVLVCLILPLAYEVLKRSTFYAGVGLGIPVVCYFMAVHLAPAKWRACWPREAMVALLFTLGTFLGVWVMNGRAVQPLIAPAILFGSLCWANCSAIENWEAQRGRGAASGVPSASARWAARHLTAVASGIAVLGALLGAFSVVPMEFAAAAVGSGVALALLGAYSSRLRVCVLRVAADGALCMPLLAFMWLG